MIKFEAGKKYRFIAHKSISCTYIYECLYTSPRGQAVLKRNDDLEFFEGCPSNYEEYIEPRKGSFWINVYASGECGNCYKTKADANAVWVDRIACVEVSWVEGQGLWVEGQGL